MDLQYPIGRFEFAGPFTDDARQQWTALIASAPSELRQAVAGLDDIQLDTPYRPDGWSVRQVVHHLPDAHMMSYTRFKFGLTEANPVIRPAQEALWANLADTRTTPIETSLALYEGLHGRWTHLIDSMTLADFDRTVEYPLRGPVPLWRILGIYAWHGRHHVAHITELKKRMGWE